MTPALVSPQKLMQTAKASMRSYMKTCTLYKNGMFLVSFFQLIVLFLACNSTPIHLVFAKNSLKHEKVRTQLEMMASDCSQIYQDWCQLPSNQCGTG